MIEGKTFQADRRQIVTVAKGIRRIDFQTTLANHSTPHQLFGVIFPIQLKGAEPVFEDRFAFLTKRKSKGKYSFQTSQNWNYSEAGVRKANRWIELGVNGRILKGDQPIATLGMTHLVYPHNRNVQQMAFDLQEAFIQRGIPVTPTYDDYDWHRRKALPHEDAQMPIPEYYDEDLAYGTSFRVSLDVGESNQYTQRVLDQLSSETQRAFEDRLKSSGIAVLMTVDEKIPDGWPPLPVLLISAKDLPMLEKKLHLFAAEMKDSAKLGLSPEEVDERGAFKLEDYGVSLLNQGTLLNSVEKDNTIVHFLVHTAAWGGTPWGKDRLPFFLVPEFRRQTFFYSLYPHKGDVREAGTVQRSWEYNNPLTAVETGLHSGKLPPEQAFFETDTEQMVLTSLKPADNPTATLHDGDVDISKGLVLRGYETLGEGTDVQLTSWISLKSAAEANLMEELQKDLPIEENGFRFHLNPNSIETFLLCPEQEKWLSAKKLGKEKEDAPALFSRFWMHNVGAASLGYEPVAVTLHGNIQSKMPIDQAGVTLATFHVGVVNNYLNRPLKTTIEFEVSDPWRVLPAKLPVEIPAGGQFWKEITLDLGPWRGRKEGLIRARISDGKDVYEDVLEVGGKFFPEWQARSKGNEIVVTVRNPFVDNLSGAVEIISPMETWPKEIVGAYSFLEITPRLRVFRLNSNEEATLRFSSSHLLKADGARDADLWIVAKLMCNGHVDYIPVMGLINA